MSLPRLDVPNYTAVVPSSGQTVNFRPFLVREQKQLLIALGGDVQQQIDAIQDLVTACTQGAVSASSPAIDIEYMFLQIRARSVGENIDLVLTCGNCEHKTDAKLDITSIKPSSAKKHEHNIDLGNITLTLKDPNLLQITEFKNNPEVEGLIKLLAQSIDKIWQGEEVFDSKDYGLNDLIEFVEHLSPQNLTKLEEFFETLPVLRHELDFTCPQCSKENTAVLEGLQSFFV